MKNMHSGSIAGMEIIILPLALFVSLALWVVFGLVAFAVLGMGFGVAVLVGLVVTLLHWLSELVHHLGHALAARRTGYPMQSVQVGGIYGFLALSSYPPGEPTLPDSIHIRRAVGGPIASLCMTLIFGIIALFLRGPFWWVAIFLCAENLIFTIQFFVPLGKLLDNDGNTLLRWWLGRGKAGVDAVAPGE